MYFCSACEGEQVSAGELHCCKHPRMVSRSIFGGLKCTGEKGWDATQSVSKDSCSVSKEPEEQDLQADIQFKINLEKNETHYALYVNGKDLKVDVRLKTFIWAQITSRMGGNHVQKITALQSLNYSKCWSLCFIWGVNFKVFYDFPSSKLDWETVVLDFSYNCDFCKPWKKQNPSLCFARSSN